MSSILSMTTPSFTKCREINPIIGLVGEKLEMLTTAPASEYNISSTIVLHLHHGNHDICFEGCFFFLSLKVIVQYTKCLVRVWYHVCAK